MSQEHFINVGPLGFAAEDSCRITVLRGYTHLSAHVKVARVQGTRFGDELQRQLDMWRTRPRGKERDASLIDLVYQRCYPVFERLAPRTKLEDSSVEGFLHSHTYNLEIVRDGDTEEVRVEGEDELESNPAFLVAPIPTVNLPEVCRRIPRFQARDVYIAPTADDGKSLDSLQGKVVTADGAALFFKPRLNLREPEFEREICILSQMNELGLATRLGVPRLEGIVVSGENTIGLLITLVSPSPIGIHLRSPELQEKSEFHGKWEEQITHLVHELHSHGIVWGDVHPMNILIDEEMNAWAVDFGGMNNVEFVDDDKRETVEGDLQGLRRVFQEWLPDPQRRVKW